MNVIRNNGNNRLDLAQFSRLRTSLTQTQPNKLDDTRDGILA